MAWNRLRMCFKDDGSEATHRAIYSGLVVIVLTSSNGYLEEFDAPLLATLAAANESGRRPMPPLS